MKTLKTILLAVLFLFFASWVYKIGMLMLLALTWRKEIKAKKEWGYKAVMGVLLIAMFCVEALYRCFEGPGRLHCPLCGNTYMVGHLYQA